MRLTDDVKNDLEAEDEGKTKTHLGIDKKDFKHIEVKVRDHIRRFSVRQ